MSTLPDLNPGEDGIEWIAFFNCISQGGAGTIDPSEALDVLDSYNLYDNGFAGKLTTAGVEVSIRMKTDGWVVAYLEQSQSNFAIDVSEQPPRGPEKIVTNGFTHYKEISEGLNNVDSNRDGPWPIAPRLKTSVRGPSR